jgi:type III secretion protein L
VARAPQDPLAEERAALLAQLAGLTAERDLLATRLQGLEAEQVAAVAAAEARGLDAGLAAGRAEAVSRADDALARLEQGLAAGLAQLVADEAALETLAARIARAALAKILDAPAEPARLVEAAIRRQLSSLATEMLVRIEVAAADFPEPQRLAHLAKSVGRGRVQLVANPALASGDCRLKLKLGEVEIGLPQQWRRLADVLDRHIAEAADVG